MAKLRYGFSDLILNDDEPTPTKYVTVYDEDGIVLGDIECFFVEEEEDEDED